MTWSKIQLQAYQKKYYLSHKGYLSAYHKKHYLLHKEEHNARDRKWYANNKKKKARYLKDWRGKHPANLKRWKITYKTKNRERYLLGKRIRKARRNALEKASVGSFTREEWEVLLTKTAFTCQRCGKKEPEVKMTIDHIIPLSKGGTNYIENIQPLCMACNVRKGVSCGVH